MVNTRCKGREIRMLYSTGNYLLKAYAHFNVLACEGETVFGGNGIDLVPAVELCMHCRFDMDSSVHQ